VARKSSNLNQNKKPAEKKRKSDAGTFLTGIGLATEIV